MKYLLTGIVVCCFLIPVQAQHTITMVIHADRQKTPLPGAVVSWKDHKTNVLSDSAGNATLTNIPGGRQTFSISHVGFQEKNVSLELPLTSSVPLSIELEIDDSEEDEVVVTATRTSRSIADIPTRTEVISGEELMEKANMKPGDIRMMLSETTGIQTQQTSATSYNSGIRIQGLDGRYTQILRDGYPLYAGFSGGLSLLQVTPLDLRQVEVIKGSASTLYGGGAIAGLVNLVSKTPGEERELKFLANATSARGLDVSGFYSEKYGSLGLTVFGSRNSSAAFDPAGIGLTAIPKSERYTFAPRLFLYGKNTTADIGLNYITEDRIGGNIAFIKNGGSGFFEENNTDRITAQLAVTRHFNEKTFLQLKSSYSRFSRSIATPSYLFDALQQSSFSEITWNARGNRFDWVAGANVLTDDLSERRPAAGRLRDYHYNTFGIFVQNTWSVSRRLNLETGLRGDYVNAFGFELLPRVSAMLAISGKLTTRLGGGLGYKSPTIFTEDAERRQFRDILPIDVDKTQNERSLGGNWDINFRTSLGKAGLSVNQMFFLTRLNRPLVLQTNSNTMEYMNSKGHLDTRGWETNLRLTYKSFKLFLGYTYTDANTHFADKEWLPLTARHRLNNVLMYEQEDNLKVGFEAYYFSRQQLSDGSHGEPYWILGFMVEKFWEKFSLFINFENFTDTRQTRFGSIYTGSFDNPVFKDIYAPLDGFVINGGVKVTL